MCCFSGEVREVAGTKIFAGAKADGRQWLVYELSAALTGDVAMVLPLPVPVGGPDDAVRFVSFEHLPSFFAELDTVFPQLLELSRQAPPEQAAALAVVEVGAFVASYVPARPDFARLDPRFRLPDAFFTALPRFSDFGFAVFQLKAPPLAKGLLERLGLRRPAAPAQHFHPMVIDFPRRDPSKLFFPTVHLHDGTVRPTAHFDHVLYAQRGDLQAGDGWQLALPAPDDAYFAQLVAKARGVLQPSGTIGKREIHGEQPNADVYL